MGRRELSCDGVMSNVCEFIITSLLLPIYCGRGVKGVVDSHSTLLPTEPWCCAVCVSVWSCSV